MIVTIESCSNTYRKSKAALKAVALELNLVKNRSLPRPKFANGFYLWLLLMYVSSANRNVPNISINESA